MIDSRDFGRLIREFARFEDEREKLIKQSRDLLRAAKEAVYLVHNNSLKAAQKALADIERRNRAIRRQTAKNPRLDFLGAYSAAMQEYVEAKSYLSFVKDRRIPAQKSLTVSADDYLLGLCDLTGELARRAVACAARQDYAEVHRIRDCVDSLYGLYLKIPMRNSELRKKSDAIKWNLKKIEDVVYDIRARGK